MTDHDYALLIAVLSDARAYIARGAWLCLVADFARRLEDDDPRFDRGRFIDAVLPVTMEGNE